MKYADHFRLANPEQCTLGHRGSRRESKRMSRDHAVLPQEFPGTHQGNRGFFSVRGGDSYSQPALLHVKNRVGRVALRVGHLIFFQTENFSAQPSSREKGLGIENRIAIFWLRLGRLKPGRLCNFACGGFCGSHRINRWNPLGWTALAAGWHAPGAHFTPPRGQTPPLRHYTS